MQHFYFNNFALMLYTAGEHSFLRKIWGDGWLRIIFLN